MRIHSDTLTRDDLYAAMRASVRVVRHPHGRRVYVAGRRVHHGAAALILLTVPIPSGRRAMVRAIAGAMLAHDIRDFPFRDTDNH